jgi:hypothetical protein
LGSTRSDRATQTANSVVVLTTRLNLIFPLPALVSGPDSQPPGDATGSVIADYRVPSIPTMPLRAVSSDLVGPWGLVGSGLVGSGLVGSGLVVHGVSSQQEPKEKRPTFTAVSSPKSTIGDIVIVPNGPPGRLGRCLDAPPKFDWRISKPQSR